MVLVLSLLSLANSQLDKKYVFGTAGPNQFDCSGFVRYCFLEAEDIILPHSAKQIGYSEDYETIKDIENLEEGDVVCFNTIKRSGALSDHVGIYLGDYQFIHCSSAKKKVVISQLDEGYYNKTFSWGKRIKSDN